MKAKIFYILPLFLFINISLCSQITAGQIPMGMIASNPNISLSVPNIFGRDIGEFDLNCDSLADMRVRLFKGVSSIDGGNSCSIEILNTAYEICSGGYVLIDGDSAKHYAYGDTLHCGSGMQWSSNSFIALGNYGCFLCYGPSQVADSYIAYKNTLSSEIGWIKLSFNIADFGLSTFAISLSITEILSPCAVTQVPIKLKGDDSCGIFAYTYNIKPTAEPPNCPYTCAGEIEITGLSGGTPPYTYDWDDFGNSSAKQGGLCNEYYSITFVDDLGNNCTSSFFVPYELKEHLLPSVNHVSCKGEENGSICINPVFGGAPYLFSWNGTSSGFNCQYSLPVGTYNICATDNNGCEVCRTVEIEEPDDSLQTLATASDASCPTCCDGNVELSPSGGTAPYSISFTLGHIPPVDNYCPGMYHYCVTDSLGCSFCDSIMVSTAVTTAVFEKDKDILFSIYPNPSIGNFTIELPDPGTYLIEITDITGQIVFQNEALSGKYTLNSNVCSGTYFVRVSDSNNRFARKRLIITQ